VADHARLLDALDEALGAQLIVERARGTFDFSHALVRHTLYEAMSSPRRALLHGQIAETVEELYASDLDAHLSELAEHFCRAAAGGDVRRGVNYACRAAERAMAIAAHEECLRLSELALRTFELDAQRDPVRRCQLVLAVAHARANVGDREAAVIAYDEAIEVARDAAQPELFAIAALGVGERAVSASVVDAQRVARLEEALEWLPPNDSALRVRLVASLTHALYYTRNWERMRALSGDAVEMAQRIGDAGATAAALNARHTALWGPRGLDERLEIARQIVEYARTARDLELEFEGSSWALVAHLESGNLAAVDAAVEALSELAERLRTPRARFNALLEHAVRAVMDGRFAEGEALAGRALAFGQRADPTNAIISFSVVMLTIRREQGRLGELLPAVQSFVQQYSAVPGWRSVLAYVYAECDRLDEASVEFETCAAGDFANFPEDANWITTMTLLSEVCFVLHDRRRGALLYDLLSPSAGLCGVVGEGSTWFGSTSRLLGLLTATLGEHKDTVRYFEKALTVNRAMNATPMVARTEYQFGRVLVELGREADRERAVALLEQARASADALGMPRLVAQCDDTLAAAGAVAASPRSAARASVDDQ
jgi:tetratricopeptide (TPR) repeat protein